MENTYLILDESRNLLKIGLSFDVDKRINQLSRNVGSKLVFISSFPYNIESELHRYFHEYRQNGEWFYYSDEIINCFKDEKFMGKILNEKEVKLKPSVDSLIKEINNNEIICLTSIIKIAQENGFNSPFNLSQWLKQKSTIELINKCENDYGFGVSIIRGRFGSVKAHKIIAIDMIANYSHDFKEKLYPNIDIFNSVKKNTTSESLLNKVVGSLFLNCKNKSKFAEELEIIMIKIKDHCGVTDWQTATEEQLKKRDKIHDAIVLLVGVVRSNDEAVRLALEKNK